MTSCGKRNRGQGRLDSLRARAIRVVARHLLSLARRKTETNGCLKTPKAISPPWKVQRLEVIAHSPSLLPKIFLISPWRSREFGSAVVDSQRPTSATQCGSPASRRSKDTVCYRMFVCNSPCSCAFRCMSGHKHTVCPKNVTIFAADPKIWHAATHRWHRPLCHKQSRCSGVVVCVNHVFVAKLIVKPSRKFEKSNICIFKRIALSGVDGWKSAPLAWQPKGPHVYVPILQTQQTAT